MVGSNRPESGSASEHRRSNDRANNRRSARASRRVPSTWKTECRRDPRTHFPGAGGTCFPRKALRIEMSWERAMSLLPDAAEALGVGLEILSNQEAQSIRQLASQHFS